MTATVSDMHHHRWRRAMETLWRDVPSLTFIMASSFELLACGGYWTTEELYVNDNGVQR